MRKDIKKRLERALITLQEPGGSTVRTIIKVINEDSPVLSLRKVLEALQEGINEGFLCMYNGRFKLRKQLYPARDRMENCAFDRDENCKPVRKTARNAPENHLLKEESDYDSDDEEEDAVSFKSKSVTPFKKSSSQFSNCWSENQPDKSHHRVSTKARKKPQFSAKEELGKKSSKGKASGKNRKYSKNPGKIECSILELTSTNIPENKSSGSTAEKPDVKKQRGPRCTSMKKDVRMPSKVHIPFIPPAVPQRSNNFNDLLRRSPDPVNGPLFDNPLFRY